MLQFLWLYFIFLQLEDRQPGWSSWWHTPATGKEKCKEWEDREKWMCDPLCLVSLFFLSLWRIYIWNNLLNWLELLKLSCVLDNSDHTSINTSSLKCWIVLAKSLGILLLQVVSFGKFKYPDFCFFFVTVRSIWIVCVSLNLKAGWNLIEWYCDKRSLVEVLSNATEKYVSTFV